MHCLIIIYLYIDIFILISFMPNNSNIQLSDMGMGILYIINNQYYN